MTNLEEEIIKCAEAGGWLHPKKKWEKRCEETKLRRCKEMNIPVEDYGNHYWVDNSDSFFVDNFSNYVLDPNFWEAIGRAKGWNKTEYRQNIPARILSRVTRNGVQKYAVSAHVRNMKKTNPLAWKKKALRFYEINLTEGWQPAIEYLYSLISKKNN